MRLRLIGGAVLVCALALSGSAAQARKASHHTRHDSQTGAGCIYGNTAVIVCGGGGAVATGRAKGRSGHVRSASAVHAGGATTSRSCLTAQTRALLEEAERHFGVTFKLVSTCRPGAIIAGTNHPSEHGFGKAVDLLPPPGRKAEVVRWFYAHAPGVTMTYARMPHIHFDTGPYHKLACGGCGRSRRMHVAHLR